MSTFTHSLRCTALAAAALLAGQAEAAFTDINLAGFTAVDDFGQSGNTEFFATVTPGSTVTGFSYSGLSFTTDPSGASYLGDLVLSVNGDVVGGSFSNYLDWSPSLTQAGGTFGPASGSWEGATGGQGPYGPGASFVSTSGTLFVTTYLSYFDEQVGINVNAGTLRIFYDVAAVPEPATYALMGLGLLSVFGAARRRV